jgi:adenine-specific DNA-methyltransferase
MPTLNWLTREADLQKSRRAQYRLLEPVPEMGYGDPTAGNLLIQGDNLGALKALLPYYAGRVKCIYIDPPYNTKSAFEHYDDNLEHSQWLSMIYPRLELLRELLSEDGSIWVSIDDNEGHYLKVVMDEIFGRRNFVTTIVWQQRTTRENRKVFSANHVTHKRDMQPRVNFMFSLPRMGSNTNFLKAGAGSIPESGWKKKFERTTFGSAPVEMEYRG